MHGLHACLFEYITVAAFHIYALREVRGRALNSMEITLLIMENHGIVFLNFLGNLAYGYKSCHCKGILSQQSYIHDINERIDLLFQPERIDPRASSKGYDVRSDIWSLGITLVSSIYYYVYLYLLQGHWLKFFPVVYRDSVCRQLLNKQ